MHMFCQLVMPDSLRPYGPHQALLSMGFCRQEYHGRLPCALPGDLPNPGIKPRSQTCILSSVKQINSPGWMHETSARTWCTGKTQRGGMGTEVGGGFGMGNNVNPWLIHVNVWQKPLQYCKVTSLQLIKINGKKKKTSGLPNAGRFFTIWSTREAPCECINYKIQ